jgi:tetratricopeptide (TPR) repeat protein
MLCRKLCLVFVGLLALGGCASTHVAGAPPTDLWQDQAFGYQSALVTETRDTLFALDDAVVQSLSTDNTVGQPTVHRLDQLVARLYGPDGIRLSYSSGHTTGATQTWHNQRGDCLSLTILAYAAARHLRIPAHMQEVQVPSTVDRRDGVDFINGHVNVFVRNDAYVTINGQVIVPGALILDFEPQAGSLRRGVWLTEDAILARFYNNRASEYLVQNDDARAYAYYRAAIATAPDYAPAYANLAQLYARKNLLDGAEQLLLRAIALGGPSYAPLRVMHQLLAAQGRSTEAQHYADLLALRQDDDPYHWLGLGMGALQDGRYAAAIAALERAASLTTGFGEIHYQLGLAYWRNGQREAANQQLAAMSAINHQDPGVAVLSKKLRGTAAASTVF